MTFSDSRIAKMLKEDFIPVWEAVAPVRTVTFNLGEGRSLKGSVSGEIAIYFCNPKGKVFDILPALQSPAATLKAMKEAKKFHQELVKIDFKIEGKDKANQLANEMKYKFTVQNMHKQRMKEMAARKYDALLKLGTEVLAKPQVIQADKVFPKSAKGEALRDAYIDAATDKATRDMRRMVASKMAAPGVSNKHRFLGDALTVVEPGGRGYYQWKIGQVYHNIYPKGYDPREKNKTAPNQSPVFYISGLMTPDEWKKMLFEGILKQELKGGEVEYDSDSLEAINLFDE